MRTTRLTSLRLFGCCVVLLSGCAVVNAVVDGLRPFIFSVTSINDPDYAGGATYFLQSPDSTINATSNLLFREYAIMVERVMETQGYTRASSEQDADLAVFLSYRIGDANRDSYLDTITGQTRTVTTYTRHLQLDARIPHNSRQVWNTSVVSTGVTGDLRTVIPMLLAAAEPYIGDNTNGPMTVRLYESSERVQRVKGTTGEE